ncbi:polysaccharide lyase family 7 protein [Alteromonas sp. C1M14]|uniref:polysaccharide lyase family 7 protein n=1 Tax=Alteromonas sp. C1M14 TaxID=2841567 RepID=UPI001C09789D|nr:polysaccharide lyase family 7 protein [Alteromonas sp. C1M14]MBU2978129.1 polysaccharide lyase family 7 protein [Alteromonas sp. C1M14]
MKKLTLTCTATMALLGTTLLAGCNDAGDSPAANSEEQQANGMHKKAPGEVFDLSSWNILLPLDSDGDGAADRVNNNDLQTFQVDDFFYLDDNNHMVFAAANKAFTSPTSTNTRSELRQVFVDENGNVPDMDSPKNYFALTSNPRADEFAALGGRMEATLKVNHVSVNAKYGDKEPAYSVVVGQIHAGKLDELRSHDSGFGWGNEPLKIYYKKFPQHKTGSVFWNYERNLVEDDANRIDIDYPVWGVGWDDKTDPADEGIALGESFSYTVNVYGDIMYLTFSADNHPTVKHQINLANNVDGNGETDTFDDPNGYKNDWLFFKVGAYNQCSTKDAPTFRYPACPGTGDWETDKQNGNYTSVSFSYLNVGEAVPVQ